MGRGNRINHRSVGNVDCIVRVGKQREINEGG